MKNLYDILDLRQDCNDSEIKKRYHKLASMYHPDKNIYNTSEAEIKFKEISEAYQILSDSNKRKNYDYYLDSLKFQSNSSFTNYNFNNDTLNYNTLNNETFIDPFLLFNQIFNNDINNNSSSFDHPIFSDSIFKPSIFEGFNNYSSNIYQTSSNSNIVNGVSNEKIIENINGVVTETIKKNGKVISQKTYVSTDKQKRKKKK